MKAANKSEPKVVKEAVQFVKKALILWVVETGHRTQQNPIIGPDPEPAESSEVPQIYYHIMVHSLPVPRGILLLRFSDD
jgi:hypothetical protein